MTVGTEVVGSDVGFLADGGADLADDHDSTAIPTTEGST